MMRAVFGKALLAIALLASTLPADAQGRRGRDEDKPRARAGRVPAVPGLTILDQLEKMTPDERDRWMLKLPPGRRAIIQRRWRAWEALAPETRIRLREQFRRFLEMTPEQQQEARSSLRRLQDLPAGRRMALRAEIRRLAQMTEEDRLQRLGSAEFQSRYSEPERRIIGDLVDLAPGQD